jgi:hypothetical protein
MLNWVAPAVPSMRYEQIRQTNVGEVMIDEKGMTRSGGVSE